MNIVSFTPSHIDGAAKIFAEQIQDSPVKDLLPDIQCAVEAWKPWIEWLSGVGRGIALMDGIDMAGYMLGLPIDSFMGPAPGIYCPEYGHGAVDSELYPVLYRAVAEKWVDKGYITHAFSVLADARQPQDALFWQGFGLHVVDGLMPIDSFPKAGLARDHDEQIRLAHRVDGPALNRLNSRYWVHLKASPVFLNWDDEEDIGDWMDRDGHYAVVAEDAGGVYGFMLAKPSGQDSSALVQGEKTIAIGGAYVDQRLRGHGVAGRLLEAVLHEGAKRGCRYCAVDFESANIEARRFWLKYFTPISLSLLRRLPPSK